MASDNPRPAALDRPEKRSPRIAASLDRTPALQSKGVALGAVSPFFGGFFVFVPCKTGDPPPRLALPLPTPVEKWIDLLGAAASPCALFAIGLFLSDKSVRSGLAEAGLATLIKLLLQPLLAACVLTYFIDIRSIAGQAALVMASLPTATNAFVLARQFDIHVERNTGALLLSTAFSVITVSALLVWLRVS